VQVLATRDGARARVEVRDSGAGIDPAVIARLFQPFSQAEPGVPRTEGGTGLGLYICRGIVEQHGGQISCSSEGPGKGASFAFTVPLAPAPEGATEGPADPFGRAPAPAQQAGEPARVL
jgi:signal transduction histidine kinase